MTIKYALTNASTSNTYTFTLETGCALGVDTRDPYADVDKRFVIAEVGGEGEQCVKTRLNKRNTSWYIPETATCEGREGEVAEGEVDVWNEVGSGRRGQEGQEQGGWCKGGGAGARAWRSWYGDYMSILIKR